MEKESFLKTVPKKKFFQKLRNSNSMCKYSLKKGLT